VSPLFAFGHGLSYTTFGYGDLSIAAGTTTDPVSVSVTVTNSGQQDGDEVVQLYVRDEVASVARPIRELIGFARVALSRGARAQVTFAVHPSRLAFHDVGVECVTEPGSFTFFVGGSSDETPLQATVALRGEIQAYPLGARVPTTATTQLID
jgi:beta-glucosidase